MDDQSIFYVDIPIRLLCPYFHKGQTSSRKKYSCREKKLIFQYRGLKYINRRSKKIEIDDNSNFKQRFINATNRATSSKIIS